MKEKSEQSKVFERTAEIFEKGALVRLFHHKDLQEKYLPDALPGLWANYQRRLIVSLMKTLFEKKIEITLENIVMAQYFPETFRFRRKEFTKTMDAEKLNIDNLSDILFDTSVSSNPELFPDIYEELHNLAFANACDRINREIEYELAYANPHAILPKARAVEKIYKAIYSHKFRKRNDPVAEAAKSINERDEFIRLSFSPKMNGLFGGWSRGWAGTLLARSSHCKSTIMTYDTILKAINDIVGDIAVISTEEQERFFYRRVFAYLLRIPMESLKNKITKITDVQVERVKQLLSNRIKFYNETDFKKVTDLLFTLRCKYIWIDHINSIKYPGNGSALQNMTGGIPSLLHHEIEYLKQFPDAAIVNLSQVNEMKLGQKPGIWKHPSYEDAYGSQALWYHAREYVTMYYPYRDSITHPKEWTGKKELTRAGKDRLYIRVEKCSYGEMSEMSLKYVIDYAMFEDFPEKVSNVEISEGLPFLQEIT